MNIIELLSERNRQFASTEFAPLPSLMPQLKTMIIACADPRVNPTHVLGLKPGETAIIRNVGGRVTPNVLREIAMLQAIGRAESSSSSGPSGSAGPVSTFNLIVLHHTDCGIARLEARRDLLATFFETPESTLAEKFISDPRSSVAADVALISANPLPPGWKVSGMLYDVKNGLVETIVPPA
jgi:carbonic anhydrase